MALSFMFSVIEAPPLPSAVQAQCIFICFAFSYSRVFLQLAVTVAVAAGISESAAAAGDEDDDNDNPEAVVVTEHIVTAHVFASLSPRKTIILPLCAARRHRFTRSEHILPAIRISLHIMPPYYRLLLKRCEKSAIAQVYGAGSTLRQRSGRDECSTNLCPTAY